MSWLDAVRNFINPVPVARGEGYVSGLNDGRDEGYKKGYDTTHETPEAAKQSLKIEAQTEVLYQMLQIVGQHYDGPITPGKVVDIIKGQGYAEGIRAGIDQGHQETAATFIAEHEAAAATIQDLRSQLAKASDSKLLTAVLELYTSAFWSPDRPVDAIALWTDVRNAAGFAPDTSPVPLTVEAKEAELTDIEAHATVIEGVLEDEGEEQCQLSSAAASPTISEKSPASSKPMNDSSSSSSSQLSSTSDISTTSTTKKKSQSSKLLKPRKPSQRKKKLTRN